METIWLENSERIDVITGELPDILQELKECPQQLLTTQTFGLVGGVALGRLVALDQKAGSASPWKEELQGVYQKVADWTIFLPAHLGLLLAVVQPEVLYAMLVLWPEEHMDKRIFFAGVLLGLVMEHAKGTEFIKDHPDVSDELLSMVSEDF